MGRRRRVRGGFWPGSKSEGQVGAQECTEVAGSNEDSGHFVKRTNTGLIESGR